MDPRPSGSSTGSNGSAGSGASGSGGDATSGGSCAAQCSGAGCCFGARDVGATGSQPIGLPGFLVVDPATNDALVGVQYNGNAEFGAGPLPAPPSNSWGSAVVRYDESGHARWSHGTTVDAGLVAVSWIGVVDGDAVVAGTLQGVTQVDFGCGSIDASALGTAFVARLAGATGACVWSRVFGAPAAWSAGVFSGAITPSGDVVLAGEAEAAVANNPQIPTTPLDLGCGPLGPEPYGFVTRVSQKDGSCVWSQAYPVELAGVGVDGSGAVYAGGNLGLVGREIEFAGSTLMSSSTADSLLLKFDEHGGEVWARRFGNGDPSANAEASIFALAVTPDQNVWVTGVTDAPVTFGAQTLSGYGVFVAGVSPDGDVIAATDILGSNQASPQLAADRAGNLLLSVAFYPGSVTVGGETFSPTGENQNFYVAKLDPKAGLAPTSTFATGSQILAVASDACGNTTVLGTYMGALDLACGLTNNGGQSADLYLARFAP